MTLPMDQQILQLIVQAESLYHRLVLVVGPSNSGKTTVLNRLAAAKGWQVVNLNLQLSRALLELPERQRPLRVQKLVASLLDSMTGGVLVLDNTEILFDVLLKLDPLRLLQSLSRERTMVVSWNGLILDGQLTFALSEHPEFKCYPLQDLLLVEAGMTNVSP